MSLQILKISSTGQHFKEFFGRYVFCYKMYGGKKLLPPKAEGQKVCLMFHAELLEHLVGALPCTLEPYRCNWVSEANSADVSQKLDVTVTCRA